MGSASCGNCHAVLEGYVYTYGEPIGNKLIDQGPKYTKDTVDNLVGDATERYPVIMTETGPLFGDGRTVLGHANIFKKENGLWAVIQTNDVFYHKFKIMLDRSGMEFSNFYGLGFYAVGGAKGKNDFRIRAVTLIRKDYAFHEIEVVYKPAHDSQMLYSLEQKYKKCISYKFNVKDMSVTYMIFDSEMKPLSSIKLHNDETGTLFPLIEELEKLDADERRVLTEL